MEQGTGGGRGSGIEGLTFISGWDQKLKYTAIMAFILVDDGTDGSKFSSSKNNDPLHWMWLALALRAAAAHS